MIATGTIGSVDVRSLSLEPPVQILHLEVNGAFSFEAGQYLEVLHPDGTAIPLSIASPPECLPALCLHYRSTPGSREADRMDALLARGGPLTLRGPGGVVSLAGDDDRGLLLICGGTGVSQGLCLAASQRARHPASPVELLAAADDPADFYFSDLLPAGVRAVLIADPSRDASNRALDWLRERARALTCDPRDVRIILCGGPAFVWAATDVLTDSGVAPTRLAADVFAWAPRT